MAAKWKDKASQSKAPQDKTPQPRHVDSSPLLPLPKQATHPEDLIDMTAMVDIVFFLLIFFLFTSIQSLQAVMNMPTPEAPSGAAGSARTVVDYEKDPEFIMLRIEDDDSFWINEEQAIGEQDLRVKLRNARNEHPEAHRILIIGDADASHGAAVKAFDACADAAISELSFSVREDTEEN